jgi:hypothetical protein
LHLLRGLAKTYRFGAGFSRRFSCRVVSHRIAETTVQHGMQNVNAQILTFNALLSSSQHDTAYTLLYQKPSQHGPFGCSS